MIHDFQDSLTASHSVSELPIWIEIYQQAFPTMVACIYHGEDGEHQRAGIDRSIILANSKQIFIDEKARFKKYDDILLEWQSNDRFSTPGWVCKPLRADYICYAIVPSGQAYLLPVQQLQQAWQRYGALWKDVYPKVIARNNTYNTLSTPVPVKILFQAMGECLRIPFTAQS